MKVRVFDIYGDRLTVNENGTAGVLSLIISINKNPKLT